MLTPTTELEAVNEMLSCISEAPVASLEDSGHLLGRRGGRSGVRNGVLLGCLDGRAGVARPCVLTEPLPPEAYARVFEGNRLPKE